MADEVALLARVVAEMRRLGVVEYHVGDVHVKLGPAPAEPRVPPKPLTESEKVAAAHEARRAKLAKSLGYPPTDKHMESLP